ncbi:hypothetical protein C3747_13g310 [Trypanosoma cruzi]|uniref:Uncharacterized protein n=1 Tax=Trypanosoma cruzi TaxID=5693 RepID=A0A2V2XCU7_TRYCR|nr:hypothetical protein C3747_13g310 [Trypanosoma cruzi]
MIAWCAIAGGRAGYPYLDEGVLATLASIAAEAYRCAIDTTHRTTAIAVDEDRALQEALAPACCFTAEDGAPGVGDKKILRQCASILGLGDVVRLQKRAIQFGSPCRTGPFLTDSKHFGVNLRLKAMDEKYADWSVFCSGGGVGAPPHWIPWLHFPLLIVGPDSPSLFPAFFFGCNKKGAGMREL